jgi:DNA-binding transcriptional LysR family regulator
MSLTPEGARLLPRAEAVLRDLEELDKAAGAPVAASHELRVGAGDALGRRRLPRAMAALLREYPGLEVEIREGPGPRLREALRNGEIDLALVVRSPTTAVQVEGLDLEGVLGSEVEVLARQGELDGGRRALKLEALAGKRLVALQRGSGFRQHLEAAFRRSGLPFRPAVEVGNLSLVGRFVAAGLGVAPVPAIAFGPRDLLQGVERRPLGGIEPVQYDRAVRTGAPLAPPTRRLLQLLRTARD